MKAHEYASTHEFDIRKRQELGVLLTRKQERALKNRERNPRTPGFCSYKRNRYIELVPISTLTQTILVPRALVEEHRPDLLEEEVN